METAMLSWSLESCRELKGRGQLHQGPQKPQNFFHHEPFFVGLKPGPKLGTRKNIRGFRVSNGDQSLGLGNPKPNHSHTPQI